MKAKIDAAIQNSLHYLTGQEWYTTDYESWVACPNRAFLEAIRVSLGGKIEFNEEVENWYLNL